MEEMRNAQRFWTENLKGIDHSKDLGVDGDNFGLDLREIVWGGVDKIHLTQNRDQWRVVVNTLMNRWAP
jgi:hypothetical protein